MTDGIIKSTGNSRYLKSVANFMSLYPTYEDFAAALIAGTLPIDLNGINASGWSQQATPMNKANLLSDSTGAMLGVGSTGTVNTAFSVLAQYNQYWWERRQIVKGTAQTTEIVELGRTGSTNIRYSSEIEYINGIISLKNPSNLAVTGSGGTSQLSTLNGKYFNISGLNADYSKVYICNGSFGSSYPTTTTIKFTCQGQLISVGALSYVKSNSQSAYPDGNISANNYYKALGKPLENFKVNRSVCFSYYGTGTYGTANPTVLEFPFEPLLVIVNMGNVDLSTYGSTIFRPNWFMWVPGVNVQNVGNGKTGSSDIRYSQIVFQNSGKTLSYYSTTDAVAQLNNQKSLYSVKAFG